jgi:diketogulonate reductase-like aldo/keto reductase
MSLHTGRILQATELRAKITRELTGTPTIQLNTFLTRDAAQLVQILENHPEAAEAVIRWHMQRTNTRVIEHSEHPGHASAAD